MKRTSPLGSVSPDYIESLQRRFREDPDSLEPTWRAYFQGLADGAGAAETEGGPANEAAATRLIDAYRRWGHLAATIDPLGLGTKEQPPDSMIKGFEPTAPVDLGGELGLGATTLGHLAGRLRDIYCGTVGYEIEHVDDPEARIWLRDRVENASREFSGDERRRMVRRLIEAESFESFVGSRFPGVKRFSGEGVDAQYVLLEHLVEKAAEFGVDELVIGPVHRGRLMLMGNFFAKPLAAIFSELSGAPTHPKGIEASGDTSYHLGLSADLTAAGRAVHVSMIPNPSHLEAIDPVMMGQARAKQDYKADEGRMRTLPLLYHTDAAAIGQGVVAEVAQLACLPGYTVGGTVHVVINNQVGFTTAADEGRSSRYCTDFAKVIGAPVFHVNADDPEASARIAELAVEFRQRFKADVVIDYVGYRRLGHNELDEPRFTQPTMYAVIDKHPSVRRQAQSAAIEEGLVTEAECADWEAAARARYEEGFNAGKRYKPNRADRFEGRWRGFRQGSEADLLKPPETGVPEARLKALGRAISTLPDGFAADDKVVKFLSARRQAVESGKKITWATAEALAFASLLADGTPVRMSGEDCTRGVFTQRHAIVADARTGRRISPFNNLGEGQARFEAYDSPLSEYAVLGYEYGYSWADPYTLTLWEAQFGDFANGAQIVVDQFVSAAEDKWLKSSGLVMLLPHGLEGGGPEHSSARLERYLALCARGNLQVMNPSCPANFFHALRGQILRDFRKPLIVMTPKSLLRHKAAVSELGEMGEGTRFRPLLSDLPAKPRRIVLCSGKVYYDLREAAGPDTDIGFVRLERLYPLDEEELIGLLSEHRGADIVWCQEEPANMGAWAYIEPRLATAMEKAGCEAPRPRYVGRPANPSPAAGLAGVHAEHQRAVVEEALAR